MNYQTCEEIESVVVRYFDPRRCMIVPNVFWGLGFRHELDLLVLTKAGYVYEIEIKISMSDLRADRRKPHGHKSNRIKKLYFAVPEKLNTALDLIPNGAGILVVKSNGALVKTREAQSNPNVRPLLGDEIRDLGRLAAMRIWPLKQAIIRLAEFNKHSDL